jgi:dynein heavy chain
MDCPRVRYPTFNDAVEAELLGAGYQVLTNAGDQVDKVVQLYEVLMTRHTVMVVGQTGGGKSVILNTLAHAQTAMGRRTTLHVLNPKAITVAELYGVLDKDTRDWTDGLLSNMFRSVPPLMTPCLAGCGGSEHLATFQLLMLPANIAGSTIWRIVYRTWDP